MTPAQHLTQAKALADSPVQAYGAYEQQARSDIQQAHALLGKAAGTGSHYAAADAALAELAGTNLLGRMAEVGGDLARSALAHALVAD